MPTRQKSLANHGKNPRPPPCFADDNVSVGVEPDHAARDQKTALMPKLGVAGRPAECLERLGGAADEAARSLLAVLGVFAADGPLRRAKPVGEPTNAMLVMRFGLPIKSLG